MVRSTSTLVDKTSIHASAKNTASTSSAYRKKLRKKSNGATSSGFKGGIDELKGHYYDCSSYQQADRFITTSKAIAEHIGRTYKDGGDIRSTFDNMVRFVIPPPTDPENNYTDIVNDITGAVVTTARAQVTYMEEEISHHEINIYIKRKVALDANIQKSYSLVLGQCTDLMKNKLKMNVNWACIRDTQDVLALLDEIRNVTFKFEDQKYPVLSIHHAKRAFYNFKQSDMGNSDYLQKFRNLVDIANSLEGNLQDDAISKIVARCDHGVDYPRDPHLTADEQLAVQENVKEIYLAVALIQQVDQKRYGKLQEELENDYTKGNNNYPVTIVKSYQLLNDSKYSHARSDSVGGGKGIVFIQKKGNGKGAKENIVFDVVWMGTQFILVPHVKLQRMFRISQMRIQINPKRIIRSPKIPTKALHWCRMMTQ